MHLLASTIGTDLFQMGIPIAEKALRTVGVYAGLLILLRLGGKRDLAQLNSFDLVVLLLLSNDVQNAVIGNDNSLLGGLLGAAILVAVNAVVVRALRRSPRGVRWFEGTATSLVHDGEVDHAALRREGLLVGDVNVAIRRQGASSVKDVEDAVLGPGGTIEVDLKPEAQLARASDIARLEAKLDRLLATAQG